MGLSEQKIIGEITEAEYFIGEIAETRLLEGIVEMGAPKLGDYYTKQQTDELIGAESDARKNGDDELTIEIAKQSDALIDHASNLEIHVTGSKQDEWDSKATREDINKAVYAEQERAQSVEIGKLNKVITPSSAKRLYMILGDGTQTTINTTESSLARDTVPTRSTGGTLYTGVATNPMHAVPLSQMQAAIQAAINDSWEGYY